jgi:hypothetical protein
MCIISGSVNKVAKTKLFVMPSKDGQRQLTVYTNAVDTPKENVMCLPVPYPHSVKFEKVPKKLFEQCKLSFPKKPTWSHPQTLSYSRSLSAEPIQIQSHGSYEVAIVPSLYEFHRVPGNFYVLSEEVKHFLFNSYPQDWGVLLCKLKEGVSDYEPFAYSHFIHNQSFFLPTKHYHKHESKNFNSGRSHFSSHADWDHELYLYYIPKQAGWKQGQGENRIEWEEVSKEFRIGPDYPLQQRIVQGSWHPNEDYFLSFLDLRARGAVNPVRGWFSSYSSRDFSMSF